MLNKALIVGSAPQSLELGSVDLNGYHKIAVNKAWRVRRDFDTHVFLKSLDKEDHPPLTAGLHPIGVQEFTPALRSAGGLYLTSGSVAMIAGYWAIATVAPAFLSYFGCDLVFSGGPQAQTHYYGSGDTGPLVGNFEYNLRQRERSIRLLCWGLLHNTIITNVSAADGTMLAFPSVPLQAETQPLLDEILSSRETLRLIRKAANVWTHEFSHRTPVFRERQKLFEADPEALAVMHGIMDEWSMLETFVIDYTARTKSLFAAAAQVKAAGHAFTPAEQVQRQNADIDIVLHVGALGLTDATIQDGLEVASAARDGCKVVPARDLKNYYTKFTNSFAQKSNKHWTAEKRNVQMARNFAQRMLEQLGVNPGDRVIINEPGALGSLAGCAYSGRLFQSPNKFLSNFAANLPAEPVEVHVSILNYATVFAEAYVTFIDRAQLDRFLTPEVMVAKVMARMTSWIDTLEGVKLSFPYAKIHVWCLDKPGSTVPAMIDVMTGVSTELLSSDLDVDDYTTWPEPDQSGRVAAFLATLRAFGLRTALETWPSTTASLDEADSRMTSTNSFNPWSRLERAHLDALYARDLDNIGADSRMILHRAADFLLAPPLHLEEQAS